MTNQIQYTVQWAVNQGSLKEFSALVQTAVDLVQANEPGMKGFNWYANDDHSTYYLAEWFSNETDIPAHLENIGETLGKALQLSQITRFELFGTLSEGMKAALKPTLDQFGAVQFHSHSGFTR